MTRFRSRTRALLLATAIATAIAGTATPGHAFIFGGRIVFDPSNYAENVLSAARALEQINNQIASLQNEAQMLINQARNLTSLPTSLMNEIQGNFDQMQTLLGQAERLAYDVQTIEQQFQQAYREIGPELSDTQLVEAARERWQLSSDAFEHAIKAGATAVGNIEGVQQQTSGLVDASQSAAGVLQATQAGNQLLAVQAQQMSDLVALLAAQGRADAMEQARNAAEHEEARERFRRFMSTSGYQPHTVRMFGN
ncbi:P-type conjugative transfer protein TrbJ [Nitratireductor rhodophyticola]|uniref:P-type conjugative transfer protein TrbJ n=1 Tax=Nitratireductor rhodophyticola TaxID=2854036 RepID=UPI003BA920A0